MEIIIMTNWFLSQWGSDGEEDLPSDLLRGPGESRHSANTRSHAPLISYLKHLVLYFFLLLLWFVNKFILSHLA